jgi:hypothetical protein
MNSAYFPIIPNLEYDSWWSLGDQYLPGTYDAAPGNWDTFGAGNFLLDGASATPSGSLGRIFSDPNAYAVFDAVTGTYRVLLGQFTSGGDISGVINISGNNSSGGTANGWTVNQISFSSTGSANTGSSGTSTSACDSTYVLNLTINNSDATTSSVTACDSYDWNGITYNTSGSHDQAFINVAGCDSVHTLVLTINNSSTGTSSETACDSYDWNATTYNTSGSYDQAFTNVAGCDSTHTLVLTITNGVTLDENIIACDSYEWNGTTYISSGTYSYTDSGPSASGFTDANTGNSIPELLAVTLENTGSGPSTGGTTYRLYAELASDDDCLVALSYSASNPLSVSTTTSFYQDATFGTNLQISMNSAYFPIIPNLEYDSWWSLGDQYLP